MSKPNTKSLQAKLKKIKILILDVDGILTDGRIFWIEGQGWTRHFNMTDGYGLRLLMQCGIDVAVISGASSKDVQTRMESLKIKNIFLGEEDKIRALQKITQTTGFSHDQMAYMGDDLFDIPVIETVGFSATVPSAVDPVKKRVDYITKNDGGWGAVREVADAIRIAQKLGPYLK